MKNLKESLRATFNPNRQNKSELDEIQRQIQESDNNEKLSSTPPKPTIVQPTLNVPSNRSSTNIVVPVNDNSKYQELDRAKNLFDTQEFDQVMVKNVNLKKDKETVVIVLKVTFGWKVELINKTQDIQLKNQGFSGEVFLRTPVKKKVKKQKKRRGDEDEGDGDDEETLITTEKFTHSSKPLILEYNAREFYSETAIMTFEISGEKGMEIGLIISQIVRVNSALSSQKVFIDENRTKTIKLDQGKYIFKLKPANNTSASNCNAFISCLVGNARRPMIKRMEKGAKDSIEFYIRTQGIVTEVTFKFGLESNLNQRAVDVDGKISVAEETPFYFVLQKLIGEEWMNNWRAESLSELKTYFINLLVSYAHQRNEKALTEIERTAKSQNSTTMSSISSYSEKLKRMVLNEERYKTDLTTAIQERNLNLILKRMVGAAKQFFNIDQKGGGENVIFQSVEIQSLISNATEVVKGLEIERNYVKRLTELLANAWVEVKKKTEEWNEDNVLKRFKQFYDEGSQYPLLKSHYFFVLEVWYTFLKVSIPNLEKIQYNCLVFLKENIPREKDFQYMKELANLDTKLKNDKCQLNEDDIAARKKSGKLFNSYFSKTIDSFYDDYEKQCIEFPLTNATDKDNEKRLVKSLNNQRRFMDSYFKYEFVFYERILIYIYKNSIDMLHRLREDAVTDPVELSQAIIDKDIDTIREKIDTSKVLDDDEIKRAQTILIIIKNQRDYSDLLNDDEKKAVELGINQFLTSNPNLADLFTNEMTLLQKAEIVKSKSNVPIRVGEKQGIISPELLFLGESDVIFTPSIREIPEKNWISELNETGLRIIQYMKKKKDAEPHLGVKEIFIEQTTGMDLKSKVKGCHFTSDMDQYVRKRILPILMEILDHKKKKGQEQTYSFSIIYKIFKEGGTTYSKKYTNYLMFLKESTNENELWTQTSENLSNVRMRMLLCFSMNHHKLQKLFTILFSSPYLRDFYKKNSFMRNPLSQKAILQTCENFDKFPFKMVITMERNEYNVNKF